MNLLLKNFLTCATVCNHGVLCGVLTLQTGYGESSIYQHRGVHGLWPQIFPYGDSRCIRPNGKESQQEICDELNTLYSCYDNPYRSTKDILEFQRHEYYKHGRCAGIKSPKDYFFQVCNLSQRPIDFMNQFCMNFQQCVFILQKYFYVNNIYDTTRQVELFACYNNSTQQWNLKRKNYFQ